MQQWFVRDCVRAPLTFRSVSRASRDDLVACWQTPGLTWLGAVFACASDQLWPMGAYGAFVIAWPLAAGLGIVAILTSLKAMSERARTRTFIPFLVIAFTLGSPLSVLRVPPVFAAGLCLAAALVALARRTFSLATALNLAAAFAALSALAVDLPKVGPREPLEMVLPSYAAGALLLVVWPRLSTRGNRRLFGWLSLAIAVATACVITFGALYEDTPRPIATAAAGTISAAAFASLWSGFRRKGPTRSASPSAFTK